MQNGWQILLAIVMVTGLSCCGDIDHSIKTMDQVKDKSDHLAKRTDDLEREAVNQGSNLSLSGKLDILFSDGEHSGKEITESNMLEAAGFAVESMHFQYWKGDYNEPMSVLDDFFAQALELMFTKSSSHIPNNYNADIKPTDFLSNASGFLKAQHDFKAVGSLASQLDRVRPEYVANLKRAGLKDLSALDVIVEALKNSQALVRKERLPKTAAIILQWKQEAIYMLQARQIYLPVMVAARSTDLEDHKDISLRFWESRVWDAYVGGSLKMDLANQDPGRKFTPEQFKKWTQWLNQSMETRQVLRDLCVVPQTSTIISRILNNVEIILPETSVLLGPTPEVKMVNSFAETFVKAIKPEAGRSLLAESCGR